MKFLVPVIGLTLPMAMSAQLLSSTRVELTGTAPADRQIVGLADPIVNDAAVSVEAARATSMSFAQVSGATQITGALQPAPTSYASGMMITIMPTEANNAAPTLDLNGLGPHPIVKWGLVPLDSADLVPGTAARLIYDGARFLLLNDVTRPCPTGFQVISPSTCISDSISATASFFDATAICNTMGGRLCTMGEWVFACQNRPAFIGTVVTAEWVDDGANSGSDGKVLGAGWSGSSEVSGTSCLYATTLPATSSRRFRCCSSR